MLNSYCILLWTQYEFMRVATHPFCFIFTFSQRTTHGRKCWRLEEVTSSSAIVHTVQCGSWFIVQVALCHFLVNKERNKLCFSSVLPSMAHLDKRGHSISQYGMLDGHATRQCHDKCSSSAATASYNHTGTLLHQMLLVFCLWCFETWPECFYLFIIC